LENAFMSRTSVRVVAAAAAAAAAAATAGLRRRQRPVLQGRHLRHQQEVERHEAAAGLRCLRGRLRRGMRLVLLRRVLRRLRLRRPHRRARRVRAGLRMRLLLLRLRAAAGGR